MRKGYLKDSVVRVVTTSELVPVWLCEIGRPNCMQKPKGTMGFFCVNTMDHWNKLGWRDLGLPASALWIPENVMSEIIVRTNICMKLPRINVLLCFTGWDAGEKLYHEYFLIFIFTLPNSFIWPLVCVFYTLYCFNSKIIHDSITLSVFSSWNEQIGEQKKWRDHEAQQ